jgi:hypothetical protein
MAGDYTLALTADGSCTQLPGAARTRKYHATITPSSWGRNKYDVKWSDGTFHDRGFGTYLGVAGSFARFMYIDEYQDNNYGFFFEEFLSPSAWLAINIRSDGFVTSSGSFSASLEGWFGYCSVFAEDRRGPR